MHKMTNDHIHSEAVRRLRIGGLIHQGKMHDQSTIVSLIEAKCDRHKIQLGHDIVYNDHAHELIYHEIFGKLGAIYLRVADTKRSLRYLSAALAGNYRALPLRKWVEDLGSDGDKYMSWPTFKTVASVILLPGSNLYKKHTNKKLIIEALDSGAYIKPHPLLSPSHFDELRDEFGGRVLNPKESGFAHVKNADVVYTTGDSELGLYALLLGKKVKSVANNNFQGGFGPLFSQVINAPNPTMALTRILSDPISGVFFPGESLKEDVDRFFERFIVSDSEIN
jgi:hypothetical protein